MPIQRLTTVDVGTATPLLIYALPPHLAGDPADAATHLERAHRMGFDAGLWLGNDGPDDGLAAFCSAANERGLRPMVALDAPDALPRLIELGFAGFRFVLNAGAQRDAWRRAVELARARVPDAPLVLDGLQLPFAALRDWLTDGYDAVLDSGAWWDGRDAWYFEQRDAIGRLAAPMGFVEDIRIGRLHERMGRHGADLAQRYMARHLWTLATSHGLTMPMGFEFASRAPLTAAAELASESQDIDGVIDLTDAIAHAHRLWRSAPAFRRVGTLRPVSATRAGVVALLRLPGGDVFDSPQAVAVLRGTAGLPGSHRRGRVGMHELSAAADGRFLDWQDIDSAASSVQPEAQGWLELAPFEVRWLAAQPTPPVGEKRPRKAVLKELTQLASQRIAIENIAPVIDGGRFAVKRRVGEVLSVSADIFCDGHDRLGAMLRIAHADDDQVHEFRLTPIGNDRWQASVCLERMGRHFFSIEAWRDPFASWREEVGKKRAFGQPLGLEIAEGIALLERAAAAAAAGTGANAEHLARMAEEVRALRHDPNEQLDRLLDEALAHEVARARLREDVTRTADALPVEVDRTRAVVGAWYEMFPRAAADDEGRHGTFDDVIGRLPYIADLGFDVLYFPPIHPIGRTHRKGANNSLLSGPDDPGSPYAIGAAEGGHDALHPELGDFDSFARLVRAAHAQGLEIALDFAIQCSPDHPWIRAHPQWFDWRPDGTLRYAENPPKKYEDIVNVSFYREGPLPDLWFALRDVVLFWIRHGVRIFRVDNPHTKPYPFWEWMIQDVRRRHPDAIFLSEAFTRPKVMARLAKLGFTQSYSYFTWRNERHELSDYLSELAHGPAVEYMRANFFVNTPDINPFYLQTSGRAGYVVRATLAATLATSWGMLAGYELCESAPIPGKEEYLDSDKYQLRARDWDAPGNIRAEIARLNRIRRTNPALWQMRNLAFQQSSHPSVIVYSKHTDERDNLVLVAVNLDPHHAAETEFEIPLWSFGLPDHGTVSVDDLLHDRHFTWTGKVQRLRLDPRDQPTAILRLSPASGWEGLQ